jgi:hypothetical protein
VPGSWGYSSRVSWDERTTRQCPEPFDATVQRPTPLIGLPLRGRAGRRCGSLHRFFSPRGCSGEATKLPRTWAF